MGSLRAPPPPARMGRMSCMTFFHSFFDIDVGPPKNLLLLVQDPSWSHLVRFWASTWSPKWTQNRYFFEPKRQLMLRCAENRPKCFRTHAGQCFVAFGPPNKAPEIVPKSIENRSQEASMLRPIFNTLKNRLQSPSRTILRRFFNIK